MPSSPTPPFLILGTPRSRTAWLASLLSVNGWKCHHEPSTEFRTLRDLEALLDTPQTGAADSMLTLLWGHILSHSPDARIVVVRRPVADVVASFRAFGGPENPDGVRLIEAIDAQAAIVARLPGVLSVPFAALARPDACQAIAAFTTGRPVSSSRLRRFQKRNIQASLPDVAAKIAANLEGFHNVFGRYLAPVR